jgi:hypothetical protein
MTNPIFAVKVCSQASHKHEWKRGYFFCPGCNDVHVLNIDIKRPLIQNYWDWDENIEKPTIAGEARVSSESRERGKLRLVKKVCIFGVKEGNIFFSPESTHQYAGQSVPLPPLPDWFFNNSASLR